MHHEGGNGSNTAQAPEPWSYFTWSHCHSVQNNTHANTLSWFGYLCFRIRSQDLSATFHGGVVCGFLHFLNNTRSPVTGSVSGLTWWSRGKRQNISDSLIQQDGFLRNWSDNLISDAQQIHDKTVTLTASYFFHSPLPSLSSSIRQK